MRIIVFSLILILLLGIGAGVFYFYYHEEPVTKPLITETKEAIVQNYTYFKIYYPVGSKMEIIEKKVPGLMNQTKKAETLIKEYLRVSRELDTGIIPPDTDILGVYISDDGTLYLDFNTSLKDNFTGDVTDEYMLLKSISDTMISNLEIEDVVILVNHKEVETIGGHFYVNRPIKELLRIYTETGTQQ